MCSEKTLPWATKAAKDQERRISKPYLLPWQEKQWEQDRAQKIEDYNADPAASAEALAGRYQRYRAHIDQLTHDGAIWLVAEHEAPELKAMQQMVNELATRNGIMPPPRVIVHEPWSPYSEKMETCHAGIVVPQYFEISIKQLDYMADNPDVFRAIAAHELAHIYNKDNSPQKGAYELAHPPTQKKEALADRRGAIIHGNPAQYAREIAKFFHDIPPDIPTQPNEGQFSSNARMRAARKWAQILEREGGTTPDGNIIKERTEEIYERSKYLADSLEQFGHQQGHQRPRG